jgi:hypothetical protein
VEKRKPCTIPVSVFLARVVGGFWCQGVGKSRVGKRLVEAGSFLLLNFPDFENFAAVEALLILGFFIFGD